MFMVYLRLTPDAPEIGVAWTPDTVPADVRVLGQRATFGEVLDLVRTYAEMLHADGGGADVVLVYPDGMRRADADVVWRTIRAVVGPVGD